MMDWTAIKHFRREEWVRNPDLVDPQLVALLDDLADVAKSQRPGTEVVIHVAWDETGHVSDSAHYTLTRPLAVAVDCSIRPWSLLDQWLLAERYPFRGIGLYPYWMSKVGLPDRGLHVDLATRAEHPDLGRRWWRDHDGTYQALNRDCFALLLKE